MIEKEDRILWSPLMVYGGRTFEKIPMSIISDDLVMAGPWLLETDLFGGGHSFLKWSVTQFLSF